MTLRRYAFAFAEGGTLDGLDSLNRAAWRLVAKREGVAYAEAIRGAREMRRAIADPLPFRSNHRIPASASEREFGIPRGWVTRG